MIINSIELQNIRSYNSEKIEFPRGITLFEGDIGSGKSTILMGIEFALFGLGSQKPEALLSKKANDGSVILNFEVGDKKCEVKRTLRRKGETLSQDPKNTYLKINEELEPLSPTELKQKVLQILNFNEPGDPRSESRIYRYAIFTPQEEMKHILYDSSKRLETIRKAFGVEDYKTSIENSREVLRFLHEKMGIFRERYKDIDRYESELKEYTESVDKIEAGNKEAMLQEKELENQRNRIRIDLDAIREKKQEQKDLESSKKNIEKQIAEKTVDQDKIAGQIKQTAVELAELEDEFRQQNEVPKPTSMSIEDIDKKISEFTEMNKIIANLEYRKTSLESDAKKLQDKLAEYKKSPIGELYAQLEKAREDKMAHQANHRKLLEELRTAQKNEAKLDSDKERYEKGVRTASELGAKCPFCEHDLTEEHKKKVEDERRQSLADTEKKLEIARKERTEIEVAISKVEQSSLDADARIKTLADVIPDLESLRMKSSELSEVENNLRQAHARNTIPKETHLTDMTGHREPVEYFTFLRGKVQQYQNIQSRMADISKSITRLSRARKEYEDDVEIKSGQIRQLGEDLARCQEKLKSLDGVDAQFSELQSSEERLDFEWRKISSHISANIEKIEYGRRRISEVEGKILEAQKWRGIHKKYSNYHEWLKEFFIPAVDKIEKQVLLSIQQNFNETYRRWYSILIDDPTKESRIDESFTPIVEQDGYEQDITFLSGGEKTSVALAYRLTLNSLMRQESESMKSNLLILDEPTDGFSKTQLAKVKAVLLELKSEQIILVSHERELETYVDNIFQINKNSGISKVVRLGN